MAAPPPQSRVLGSILENKIAEKLDCKSTSPPALKYADIIDLVEDRNDLLESPNSCFFSVRLLIEVSKSSIVGGIPFNEKASFNASVRPSFVTKRRAMR